MKALASLLISVLVLGASAGSLKAQGDQPDMQKFQQLVRQIHRNMKKVEMELAKVEAEGAGEAGEQAKKDMDELIEKLRGRSGQIVKDMDELIKNWPQGKGGGGSSQQPNKSNKPMPKDRSQARDRNKKKGQGKPQNQSDQGKKGKKDQEGKEGKGKKPGQEPKNGQENNKGKNPKSGSNQDGAKKEPTPAEKVRHQNLINRWGVLPPELKQKLVDRDFKEFTPEYEAKIRAYLKRIASPRKKR